MTKKKFKEEELRKLLQTYLLTTGQGPMGIVVDEIVKAYIHEKAIALIYVSGVIPKFNKFLTALGIKSTFHDRKVSSHGHVNYFPFLPNDSRPILIPKYSERFCDLELLVPFYFSKCVKEYEKKTSKLVDFQIEGLYLLNFFGINKSWSKISDLVSNSLIDIESNVVWGTNKYQLNHKYHYGSIRSENKKFYTYLGLVNSKEDDEAIPTPQELINHWFNLEYNNSDKYCGPSPFGGNTHYPPSYKHQICFSLDHIGLAARNISFYMENEDQFKEKVAEVCLMRIKGFSEKQIQKEMGFSKLSDYKKWLSDNHIDIISNKKDKTYYDWISAGKQLIGNQFDSETGPGEHFGFDDDTKIEPKVTLSKTENNDNTIKSFIPEGTPWGEITLIRDSEFGYRILVNDEVKNVNIEDFGFEDGRSKKGGCLKGTQLWKLLNLFAKNSGQLNWYMNDAEDDLEKPISRFQVELKRIFGINTNPISDYRKEKAYITNFDIYESEDYKKNIS